MVAALPVFVYAFLIDFGSALPASFSIARERPLSFENRKMRTELIYRSPR
jgi:hypothetical protein